MTKPSASYDGKYELIEEMHILLFPMRYKVILNDLRHLEKGRLLDVGCGEGVLLENAKSLGFDATGIDYSEQAVKMCHKKNLDAICLDIEREGLPFNEEFDVVIAAEIIEHLSDHYRFLASVNNCLREKGLLFLTTPNSAWFVQRIRSLLGRTPTQVQNPLHVRFFSLPHLLRICREQGFSLERNLAYASFPWIEYGFKVPSFLLNLLSRDFVLVLRKDDKPKYSDLTPVVEEWRKRWLKPDSTALLEKLP